MMGDRNLIPIELENGAVIYIESDIDTGRELVSSSNSNYKIKQLKKQIEGIAIFLVDSLENLSPTKIGAKFSLELEVSEGALVGIFAKGSTKGTIEVTLEWDKK